MDADAKATHVPATRARERQCHQKARLLEPDRDFVPARNDVAELSELADLEKLSLVSYNVLSQMGARRLQRAGSGYVDASILTIAARREKLLRELVSYDADILCLQEVDDYDDWWAAQLTAVGYDSVFAPRPRASDSSDTMDEGLVTAFRRDAFQLFRSKQIDLNDVRDNIGDPNLQARAKQDNAALLLCLQPWESSRLPSAVCVANTQLASGPTLELVRVLQTEFLCRQIGIFNADFHVPIIFAGSFNALPSSDVYHPADPTAPVLEYKIAVKNCTSAAIGFMHEVLVSAPASAFVVPTLSSGTTYQFRLAARNAYGWSHFSQPSAPVVTSVAVKLIAGSKAVALRAQSKTPIRDDDGKGGDDDDNDDDAPKLYIVGDFPPLVKPYDASFGSGRTPRFDTERLNLDVCPRALASSCDFSADAKCYRTLSVRADRDDRLVHGEQMESAYAQYFESLCEPELTFSSPKLQGTIDYIFYSSRQLAPFQLLALPTADELLEVGDDVRVPLVMRDVEWAKHKPRDWRDALETRGDEDRYMGEWEAPLLFNIVERPSPWLPNAMFPSDHLAIACVFAMRKDNLADAEALTAVQGQVGTLVLDLEGQVLSATGQLAGDAGEQAAESVFSILQDAASVLEGAKNEVLERVTISFPSYSYVVAVNGSEIYVVKRSRSAQD
ncbi:hypothetical protein PybrP1_001884 [[Pythium] brassicae (nom. inval.)]|nr:hypothetical protein PybrP1_001884 [[Pythium] brassicae (nom. inval.)]